MGRLTALEAAPSARWVAVAILAAAAIPRLWAAVFDLGIFWPDEIYQSLEPAHEMAFGFGSRAWEFIDGARSWLFPGVIGLYFMLLAALGIDGGTELVIGAKLLMAVVSLAGVWGAMRLAQALGGTVAAWLAGLAAAAFPALVVFAARGMAEMASGTLLVFAALALVRRGPRDALLAGALCGAAVFLRYPNGIVLLGFLAWLVAARRGDDVRHFMAAALAVGVLGGGLDWITWGAPFHSLRVYARFNLQFQADLFGTEPAAYYAVTAWTSTGPAVVALALGLVLALRRAPARALALVALAYGLAHSAVGHKELRFLAPVMPLLLALAGTGLAAVFQAARAPAVVALLAGTATAAAMGHRAATAAFADFGQYRGEPAGEVSPWHALEGANRLIEVAGEQPDLCGLWVTGVRPVHVSGYVQLRKDVPFLKGDTEILAPFTNYALVPIEPLPFPLAVAPAANIPPAYVVIAESQGWYLLRRDGECARAP